MSDGDRRGPEDYPEARRRRSARFAWVWAIPIAAVVVSGWLALREWAIGPEEVVARFQSAEGVSEGAPIRYRGLKVGEVQKVRVAEGLGHVELTLGIEDPVAERLGPGTRIWIDRPALLEGELRGLISGAGVAIEPGAPTAEDAPLVFDGLEEPPILSPDEPGASFVLLAEEAGALSRGSPVLHRGVEVGRVLGTSLNAEADRVEVVVFVDGAWAALVTEDAVFWHAGGISASLAGGLEVDLPSPGALISGAVAFAAPGGDGAGPAEPGATFELHDGPDAAESALAADGPGRRFVLLAEEAGGLSRGAPVLHRGVEVGRVLGTSLRPEGVAVEILVEASHAARVTEAAAFWRAGGVSASLGDGLEVELPSLGALISGAVAFAAPEGAAEAAEPGAVFELHESRDAAEPLLAVSGPGRRFVLLAKEGSGLSAGAPVLFLGTEVGRVVATRLDAEARRVEVGIVVEPEHAGLVTEDSVFWRAGGASFSLAGGPSAEIPPLPALLAGGVAFSTPRLFTGPPAEPGAVFALYDSRDRALAAPGGGDFLYATRFPRAVGGVEPGTAVTLEGREVGRVTRVALEVAPETGELATVVGYTLDALAFLDVEAEDAESREALRRRLNEAVAALIEAGMRASIKSGGLLSGGPTVDLVTIEGVEAAELALEREPPRIPPAPSG